MGCFWPTYQMYLFGLFSIVIGTIYFTICITSLPCKLPSRTPTLCSLVDVASLHYHVKEALKLRYSMLILHLRFLGRTNPSLYFFLLPRFQKLTCFLVHTSSFLAFIKNIQENYVDLDDTRWFWNNNSTKCTAKVLNISRNFVKCFC